MQPDERNPPYVLGSRTSKAASNFIKPLRESMAERIFRALSTVPQTCAEVEVAMGLKHQSCSARFNELAAAGCIEPTGVTRALKNGKPASEEYRVRPGASFDDFRAWQKKQKPSVTRQKAWEVERANLLARIAQLEFELEKAKKGSQLKLF